ncbi:MAG: hypothetical protein MJ066_03270 [Clostridia bacterium]|nr:hypothetical protein [Clostridia bacterium]
MNKLKNFFTNKTIKYLLVILLLIGLVVLIISSFNFDFNSSKDEVSIYISNLENKLEKCLSNVEGAGKVSVVISVDSGMETVLATKTTEDETLNGIKREESPIIVNGKTVVIKEMYPKITGVLIVADGAKDLNVYKRIQQATMSLLDVEINKIEILTRK